MYSEGKAREGTVDEKSEPASHLAVTRYSETHVSSDWTAHEWDCMCVQTLENPQTCQS